MDRIGKALKRLTAEERKNIKFILEKIYTGNFQGLDIKKLKGRDDIFRVRKGVLRIIYGIKNRHIFILAIERRKENTYKF